jgi:hypothetical protein
MACYAGDETQQEMIRLYVEEKKSTTQIAERLSIPVSTVQHRLKVNGIPLRSRAEGVRLRSDVLGLQAKGRTRTMTPEWRANIANGRRSWGMKHAVGTRINSQGYVEYTVGPNNGRRVHDVKMEERIGRKLLPDEIVHHIDEDKQNNDWDNLALMTHAAHSRLHQRQRREFLQGVM